MKEKKENTAFRKSSGAKKENTAPEKSSGAKAEALEKSSGAKKEKGNAKEKAEKAKEKKKPKAKRTEKNKEALLLQEMIKDKWKPSFRGRFGKKCLRRKKKEKWSKWRKPRGIDIKRRQEDGMLPKSGYRTKKEIRFVHPSGMKELRIENTKELEEAKKGFAVRISGRVGKKKKKIIIKKAKEMGLRILN